MGKKMIKKPKKSIVFHFAEVLLSILVKKIIKLVIFKGGI